MSTHLGTNIQGVATRTLGLICTRLRGDLPKGRGTFLEDGKSMLHSPMEQCGCEQNVPNHITELPKAAGHALPSQTWLSWAAWPLVSTFPEKSEPPEELMGTCCPGPSLDSLPLQTWERLLLGPWGNFPLKNQSPGISSPSWRGDGDMFPISELKI